MRYVLLILIQFGCIEAPPSALPNNVQTNNSETNNSETNNTQPNNSVETFVPFSISTDLELHYLFNLGSSQNGFPNRAPGGGNHPLEDSQVIDSEMVVLGNDSSVGFLDNVFSAIQTRREVSIEMWWRPFDSLNRNVISLGERISIGMNQNQEVELNIGPKRYAISGIGGPFSTHFVLTLSDEVARVYVDGIQVWAQKTEDPAFFDDLGEAMLRLGPGNIAYKQVSVYKRLLSPGEIAMHTFQGPGKESRQPTRPDLFAEAYRHSNHVDNLRKDFVYTAISPGDEASGFTFSAGNREAAQPLWFVPLSRDHFPPNSAHIHGYARVQGRHHNSESPFEIEVYALKRRWSPANVTWTQADSSTQWAQPGAKSTDDRGEEPIFKSPVIEFPPNGNFPIYLLFPLTSVIEPWFNNDANFGLIFDAQDKLHGALGDDPPWQPAMVFFGVSRSQSPIESPVIGVATQSNNCEVTFSKLPPGQKLEVWHEGSFAGVTSGTRLVIPECDEDKLTYSIFDVFGNSTFF